MFLSERRFAGLKTKKANMSSTFLVTIIISKQNLVILRYTLVMILSKEGKHVKTYVQLNLDFHFLFNNVSKQKGQMKQLDHGILQFIYMIKAIMSV